MFFDKRKKLKKMAAKDHAMRKKKMMADKARQEAMSQQAAMQGPVSQNPQAAAPKQPDSKPPQQPKGDKNWAQKKKDAFEARAHHYLTIEDDLPLYQHLLLFIVVAFVIFFCVWANFASLDEISRGDGRVIPSGEIKQIQSLEGGIIQEFMVKEGDSVKAGQVLAQLEDIAASSDLGSNKARYLGLQASIERLKAEAEGLSAPKFSEAVKKGAPQNMAEEMRTFLANRQQVRSQLSILEQQLSQRKQEVRELQTRSSDVNRVMNLTKQELEVIRPLVAKGSAPKMEVLQLERQIAERRTEINGLYSAIPRAKSAVKEAQSRINDIKQAAKTDAQAELSVKAVERDAIKSMLTSFVDRKKRTALTSPVNGVVQDLKITTVGGVVKPGDSIMEIIPLDDQLLVEARIKPSDIAFIYPGQEATVKITAYDFSIYGGLKGNVSVISADTVTNEKGESFYVVKVTTQETALKRKGEVLEIKPGMVASVDVLTGKKTVMEYLLKPFIKTLNNAMHER